MHHYGLVHLIAGTIVKGIVYGVIWKIMRQLSLPEDIALGVVVVGVLAAMNRRRGWY
ncbi:hypothetical protein [Acidocella sp. KAb 2-4]|uniref:hypothetical protein n=1 Tax=Acidocella sp. KAb 2-4 TaxID=2885158 RepID=UPI001D08B930|nr:hypothetical protein [Acidocella sp. KAb 2-4]MCB5946002.1 hypothetical protein [Acidocella sp. KAb 2-4]